MITIILFIAAIACELAALAFERASQAHLSAFAFDRAVEAETTARALTASGWVLLLASFVVLFL